MKDKRIIAVAAILSTALLLICGCKSAEKRNAAGNSDPAGGEYAGDTASLTGYDLSPESSSQFVPDQSSVLIREYGTDLVFRDQGNGYAYLVVDGNRVIKEYLTESGRRKMSIKKANIERVDVTAHSDHTNFRIYDATGYYLEVDISADEAERARRAIGR